MEFFLPKFRCVRNCVFAYRELCPWGRVTKFYSPQAPINRVGTPLSQIDITDQFESLYKRQNFFENPHEPTLGFD